MGYTLDKKNAQLLVYRVGVDQWLLYQALQKLAVVEVITPEVIEDLIDAHPTENVFNLFEAATAGNTERTQAMLATLKIDQDPYRLFGLLSGQAVQLLALTVTDKPSGEVAKDLGAHTFALSKLVPTAKKQGQSGATIIIQHFVQADNALKTSAIDPWLIIEQLLLKISAYALK